LDVSAECTRRIVAVDGAVKAICNRLVLVNPDDRTSSDLSEQCVKAATAAAAPSAAYPGNLLHPGHIDPTVYQLMQQTGMHSQYMYPNPVMQQLHQQQLQHHYSKY
jgi:hypothetical protein